MRSKNNQTRAEKEAPQPTEYKFKKAKHEIKASFKQLATSLYKSQNLTQTRQAIVINELIESSSPGFEYFIMIILSCIITTFGLITNSAAVIIGAMLVAPLMSPILGLSMASLTGRHIMFRRSLFSVLESVAIAVLLSSMISWLTYRLPFGLLAEMPSEVLARTHPLPLDLGIALAGGAAAAFAMARPRLTAALPGVAIATALMPPLCTIGIGITFANPSILFGSLLLFFTNLTAISFAGIITFALMGFRSINQQKSRGKLPKSIRISAVLVMLITIPLAILAWNTISEAQFYNRAKEAITEGLSPLTDAKLVDLVITRERDTKRLQVTIHSSSNLSYSQVVTLQEQVAQRLQVPIALELINIPIEKINPLVPPTPTPAPT